jgi:hypothetical protein
MGPVIPEVCEYDFSKDEVTEVPETDGDITAAIDDGDGGAFFAGRFTEIAGVAVQGLAHVRADGSVDDKLRDGVELFCGDGLQSEQCYETSILSMARVGQTLYLGGTFVAVAGGERKYLAALDIETGELLPWNPYGFPTDNDKHQRVSCTMGEDFGVKSMATDGTSIFAAGCTLDAFDATSGERVETFRGPLMTKHNGDDQTLSRIAVEGDVLWLNGNFESLWYPAAPNDYQNGEAVPRSQWAALDRRTGDVLSRCAP